MTASSPSRAIRPTTRRHRAKRDVRLRFKSRSKCPLLAIQAIRTGTLLPSSPLSHTHRTPSSLPLLISAPSTVRRAGLVRRIQRDDRRDQATRRRRQHVRLHAPAGSPDMRRDPPTGPRRADADYRHTSDLAGPAAEEVFGRGQTVGRLS